MLALILVLHSELENPLGVAETLELLGYLAVFLNMNQQIKWFSMSVFAYVKLNYVIVSVSSILSSVAPVCWVGCLIKILPHVFYVK